MNRTEHLLSCLAEEAAEVGQRASKALRFGIQEIQPGQSLTNEQRLMGEVLDLITIVQMLEADGVFRPRDFRADKVIIEQKKAKVEKFMLYAREQGALS